VDGIGWGSTPLTIRHLTPGTKRIRVSKPGYATQERVTFLDGGSGATITIPLTTATQTHPESAFQN
jgi:hypothetical protein